MAQTKQVTLDPGGSQVVAFTVTPAMAGIFAIAINGLSGSFEVIDVAPAGIALRNLRLDAINVPAGTKITATATATNYGDAYEYKYISLSVWYWRTPTSPTGMNFTEGVGLYPGESANVNFEFTPYSLGDYTTFIDGTPSHAPADLVVEFTVY